jgi:ATP phosphoribosyltransferase regulatory subunit
MRVMEHTKRQTPRGTKDCLPIQAAQRRAVEKLILKVFAAWGYQEIITPTYEFYDALRVGGGWDLEQKMFKFFDREGEILALRPDLTTPIARVVAARLQDEPKPLRLAYNAPVFRHEESQMWRYREFHQAGAELIGARGPASDGEIIALAHAILQECGLRPQIDIGHVDYCRGLLEETGLDARSQRRLRSALLRRDYVLLREFLEERSVASQLKQHILTLPRLRGGPEVLLSEDFGNPRCQRALRELGEIEELLRSWDITAGIWIDLGLVKDLEYYTGMVFEGYTRDSGWPLCTGGRYDDLIGRFGYDCPATGFAVGIESLFSLMEKQGVLPKVKTGPDWLVVYAPARSREGWDLARQLRALGARVVVEPEGAESWQDRGIPQVVHLEGEAWGLGILYRGETKREAALADLLEEKANG